MSVFHSYYNNYDFPFALLIIIFNVKILYSFKLNMHFDPNMGTSLLVLFTYNYIYYPQYPIVTKRKYYDLIQNLPLFIPNEDIANNFSNMLDKYPVTPYLDNIDSFKKWMHFIHNKVNFMLNKDEISFEKADELYRKQFVPKTILVSESLLIIKHHLYLIFTLICF